MIPQMNASDIAQAMELVRALRDQLHEMTHRLVLLECQGVTGTNGRASAIRCEAVALRLDIPRRSFTFTGYSSVTSTATDTPPRANSLNRPGEAGTLTASLSVLARRRSAWPELDLA